MSCCDVHFFRFAFSALAQKCVRLTRRIGIHARSSSQMCWLVLFFFSVFLHLIQLVLRCKRNTADVAMTNHKLKRSRREREYAIIVCLVYILEWDTHLYVSVGGMRGKWDIFYSNWRPAIHFRAQWLSLPRAGLGERTRAAKQVRR